MKYLPIYLPIYLPGLNISKSTLGDLAQPLFATRSQVSQGSELEWFLSEVAGEVTHQVPWPSDAMDENIALSVNMKYIEIPHQATFCLRSK
jgi:hypothetical protein